MKKIINPFTHLEGYNCFGCNYLWAVLAISQKICTFANIIISFYPPIHSFALWKSTSTT